MAPPGGPPSPGRTAPGHCYSCGLFCKAAALAEDQAPLYYEALWGVRERGTVFTEGNLTTGPFCLHNVEEFWDEVEAMELSAFEVRRLLTKDRGCAKWFQYTMGQSPQLHLERQERMQVEEMRQLSEQRWQETALKIMSEQNATAAEHAKTAEAHKAIFERSDKQATWFQWAFIALAVVALALALTPLCYPSGAKWFVDHAPGAVQEQSSHTPAPQVTP